jgi:hypothetical protein
MVSIQGLPPALIQKQQAVGKKNQVKKAGGDKATDAIDRHRLVNNC